MTLVVEFFVISQVAKPFWIRISITSPYWNPYPCLSCGLSSQISPSCPKYPIISNDFFAFNLETLAMGITAMYMSLCWECRILTLKDEQPPTFNYLFSTNWWWWFVVPINVTFLPYMRKKRLFDKWTGSINRFCSLLLLLCSFGRKLRVFSGI